MSGTNLTYLRKRLCNKVVESFLVGKLDFLITEIPNENFIGSFEKFLLTFIFFGKHRETQREREREREREGGREKERTFGFRAE